MIRRFMAKRKPWRAAGPLGVVAVGLVIAQVVVAAPPAVTPSVTNDNPRIGESVDFSATVEGDPGETHTFLWNFGDGDISTDENPSHAYATAGDKTVSLTVSDPSDPPETTTVTLELHVNAPPVAEFTASPTVPLIGQPVTLSSTVTDPDAGDAHTFEWDFGDGTSGTGANPSHPYATAGNKTVTLTVTDAAGD